MNRNSNGCGWKRQRDSSPEHSRKKSPDGVKVVTYFDGFGMELWKVCPLDNGHYIKMKDMEQHLMACKLRLLIDTKKVECPYNPLHIVSRMEIEEHMMICENHVPLNNSGIGFEPKRDLIEGVAMAPMNGRPIFDTYWDEEEPPEASYNPAEHTKFLPVYLPMPPGLSKTQKKAYKEKERQRHRWLTGETKEKPRSSPSPAPAQMQSCRSPDRNEEIVKEEDDVMKSITNGLKNAKIGDPRNAIMKQINARLRVLQMMSAKLKEEQISLQRQVQEYLNSDENEGEVANRDPRRAGRAFEEITANITANVDPRPAAEEASSLVNAFSFASFE